MTEAISDAAQRGRIRRVFAALDVGSSRISAMIMGETELGDLIVMGSGQRKSAGVKRGYIVDREAATNAIRDAIERAERAAQTSIESVWIACSGAGLSSEVNKVEIEIGGRRIEEEDVELLLLEAKSMLRPDGRTVLHAQPAHYTLDGAHGIANPRGLHAERLGVDIHVVLADGAPVRNLTEAVQSAHLDVEAVVAAPLAAGYACLTEEERELGAALIEIGSDVTNVSVFAAGMLLGLRAIPLGSGDITDRVASSFGIRRFQAERLKCVAGSAIASPSDYREMVPVHGPNETPVAGAAMARGADEFNRIVRAELIGVITQVQSQMMDGIGRALKELGFTGARSGQIVLTGGGAELAGLADFAQGALASAVRIGRAPALAGLPEAHSVPAYAGLCGLCLYAADDPIDIRAIGVDRRKGPAGAATGSPFSLLGQFWRAARESF
ncbi:MAG: cell division protein FtsA [Erythrobacter sp.]|jgi:cell division protein FtsA|nr:cell division protein FtsA [Erythrobacter sp.]